MLKKPAETAHDAYQQPVIQAVKNEYYLKKKTQKYCNNKYIKPKYAFNKKYTRDIRTSS